MKLNSNKIQFCEKEVKLLGVGLNGVDITPSKIKKNEALEFSVPPVVSDVRRFLGLNGWFRDFIKDYATKTIKLTYSLKDKSKDWKWTKEMNLKFIDLKKTLSELVELRIVNYEKEFLLRTDESNTGMGAGQRRMGIGSLGIEEVSPT